MVCCCFVSRRSCESVRCFDQATSEHRSTDHQETRHGSSGSSRRDVKSAARHERTKTHGSRSSASTEVLLLLVQIVRKSDELWSTNSKNIELGIYSLSKVVRSHARLQPLGTELIPVSCVYHEMSFCTVTHHDIIRYY